MISDDLEEVVRAARAVIHAKLQEPGRIREPELSARVMDLGDALESYDKAQHTGHYDVPVDTVDDTVIPS